MSNSQIRIATMIDFAALRQGLSRLETSASHSASGESRPRADEIFAPEQHAGALDPNTTIVLGSRGAGKSFWAGVLGDEDTKLAAASAYPQLALEDVVVKFGFTGIAGDGSVSKETIDAQVPPGEERVRANLLWRCVILRSLLTTLCPSEKYRIGTMMKEFADPEIWEEACTEANEKLSRQGKRVLVIFDALDGLALDWSRLGELIDSLLEVSWSVRGFSSVRAKLFLRPDQMRDLGLRFVELPKMIAGATNLNWSGANLYGMFFARLAAIRDPEFVRSYSELLASEGISPSINLQNLRRWPLAYNRGIQARIFTKFAGQFMGKSNKKGRTYDWPLNHLSDGHGEVTPRSFMMLMISSVEGSAAPANQAITAEGIRHGLREASKVRVNQLELEFPWIKRVLAPLARLQVPCTYESLLLRWEETETLEAVLARVGNGDFLPPFDPRAEGSNESKLVSRLVKIGIMTVRNDGRYDMPDLFRVAAKLLKKGGVAPT